MTLLFAFNFIPVPVFYTSWLPFGAGGMSPCFFILILSKFRGDAGLHAHELGHIEHAYKLGWIGWLVMYFASKKFRQADEVCQYKKQIALGMSIHLAAQYLSKNYNLGITIGEATRLLSD